MAKPGGKKRNTKEQNAGVPIEAKRKKKTTDGGRETIKTSYEFKNE